MASTAINVPRVRDVVHSDGSSSHVAPRVGAGGCFEVADWYSVKSPYDGREIAYAPSCTPRDIERASALALAHMEQGLAQHERAQVLSRAASLLLEAKEPFATIIASEAGKPIRAARAEVARCIDTLTLSAAEALVLSGAAVPMDATSSGAGRLGFALRVPVGVVGAITPFNFPLNLVAHKVAPAIAAGCPVVLKPAPATPLSALAFAELLYDAGLPDGWLSVITGPGNELGATLVSSPEVRLVSFTGSCNVGWAIAAAAPRKRVCLELGSNAPVIIEPDTDVHAAVPRIAAAAYGYSGQSCISVQRVLAHEDVVEELSSDIAAYANQLVVGDPLDEHTDVGPVINAQSAERIVRSIDVAQDDGARLLAGGSANGNLIDPTVLATVKDDSPLWNEEIFGPVCVIMPYKSFDDAIRLANASDFGLHAGVFTNNLSVALQAARRLEFGGVVVNDVPTLRVDQQPYGGVKTSGNTREGPRYAIEAMTELRFVSLGPAE